MQRARCCAHIDFHVLWLLIGLLSMRFFRVDINIGSKIRDMPIHYQQYTDTFSILNYLQNHRLWRKNGQKLVLYYPENSKLPTESSFVEKKNGQNWYYIIQKIIERSILASHVQCLLQKWTSHQVAGAFNAIQHRGDILPIRTWGDFYMSFVYRHCHGV